ncbi:MAG TPA: molybdate ABC transporter permease subunit [Polyangiaceae bacterium]|nr:molybdate ABC transporter permease subunit [Polyangiaceae bacterium]
MLTGEELSILWLTLGIATTSTIAILPLGILGAWLLSRWRGPGRGLVETILSLPLVLPPTSVGLLLLQLLAKSGPIGRALDSLGVEVVFTWRAVVLACATMSFPLLVRPLRAAFEEIEPRLIAVARTLGRGPLEVFLRLILPLSWRGLVTGGLLAFSRALGEFGATILIAGNIPGRTQTLSLAIFQRAETGHNTEALRLSGLTVLLAFGLMWTTELITTRRTRRLRT